MKKFFQEIIRKIKLKIRFWAIKDKLGHVEGFLKIGENVTFQNPDCIYFGKNNTINKDVLFLPVKNYAGCSYSPKIEIGDGVWFGTRNSFGCIDKIKIGNNVLFAGFVHITDHSHGYEDYDAPIMEQKLISKGPVIIDDDCWLGFCCEILSGVHIGKHSIVAAHSVVTKDVPEYSIVAGNPARIIKQYNPQSKTWEKSL